MTSTVLRLVSRGWSGVRTALAWVGIRALAAPLLAWEFLESGVVNNPLSRKKWANPYPYYARLRRRDPVHRMRTANMWTLTRHEEVEAVLRDPRTFSNEGLDYGYARHRVVTLLDIDPPDHTRLRRLVSRAFTPRAVSRLEGRISKIAEDLLDSLGETRRFDLMSSFAYPLPLTVIAEMIGVPPRDMDRFEDWSDGLALSIEAVLNRRQVRRVEECNKALFDYFLELIEERRQDPGDDLISTLLSVEEEGDRLSREELISMLMLLLVAGNETTRNLIGNGMMALLEHPDQLRRLRDDPELIDAAVQEILRYDSPVQMVARRVTEDTEVGGRQLRAGQSVLPFVAAANRDPSVYREPDRFDIGRSEKGHMSFGQGIHYCLGSSLAVLEGRVAFAALLRRYPSIRLVSRPEHREQMVLRGHRELWLEVGEPSAIA